MFSKSSLFEFNDQYDMNNYLEKRITFYRFWHVSLYVLRMFDKSSDEILNFYNLIYLNH